jgi:NADPH:quinone reductase-like Zn-dependent oxidoreductase
MKAIVINRYGDSKVLQYTELERPIPQANEVLIKIMAAGINPIDWKIRRGMLKIATGNNFPLQLGFDYAGIIVEKGSQVDQFQLGDEVFGFVNKLPGQTYAEYVTIPASLLVKKPINQSFIEAAATPLAAATALQVLRDFGSIQVGNRVLVNGASGGVGSFAVQIAKIFSAKVDGVCSSRNIDYVASLGVDKVIDYKQEDWTKTEEKYDIIFDAVAKSSFSKCRQLLKPQGIYITTLPNLEIIFLNYLTAWLPQKAKVIFFAQAKASDWQFLKEAIELGKLTVRIDKIYPFSQVIAAHNYSESERVRGKIVLIPDEV